MIRALTHLAIRVATEIIWRLWPIELAAHRRLRNLPAQIGRDTTEGNP